MNHIYVNIFVDKVKFCIVNYEKNERRKIKENEIVIPVSFSMGEKLHYIRKLISAITNQYNIELYSIEVDSDVGIEIIDVVKIEGVLEELFSCKGVVIWK